MTYDPRIKNWAGIYGNWPKDSEDTQLPLGKQCRDSVWLGDYDHATGTNNWCSHEYVNVGFHHDKWVCKKCDKEKLDANSNT